MADWDFTTDALIVGSGGGGLVGALTGSSRGLDVLVVEKTDLVGGSTALSAGGLWIPNNPMMQADGVPDSDEAALEYFAATVGEVGPASSPERREAFVREGPKMIELLLDDGIRLIRGEGWPDYYSSAPGASVRGRNLEPLPFDLDELGPWKAKVRPGMTIGMKGIAGTMHELLVMSMWNRGVEAFSVAARVMSRTALAKLRGQPLVCGGGSLIGQLLKAAIAREVPVWTESPVKELVVEGDRVAGAVIERHGRQVRVAARHGVLLAAGGFSRNREMREQYFGDGDMVERTRANPGDTGEVMQMAMALGAQTELMDQAIWIPTSMMEDGSPAQYPGLRSVGFSRTRERPGSIIVDAAGTRFVNESSSYMAIGQKMLARDKEVRAIPSWLILDDRARRRYVHGWIPGLLPEQWVTDGFIRRADTLRDLAAQCGIDADGLEATVERFNAGARDGVDPEFHRGDTAYEQFLGDPAQRPNRQLAPLDQPPFYAAATFPADIGTWGGLLADARARILRTDGTPIPGLWGTGTVTASVCGRSYLGPGASIGPTCTFAFVAMHDIANGAKAGT